MAITDWPKSERPREKLLHSGATSLSDAELLAIFLRTGITGKSALDLARELIQHFGSLNGLFAADHHILCQQPGIGSAKFAQLQAVLEMARRALEETIKTGDLLSSPQAVKNFLRLTLGNKQKEIFLGIFMDARNHIISTEELFTGTLTQTSVYPREVVKRTLHHNAASIIFAHNHPAGSLDPSHADKILTQTLKQALTLIDVKVLDHFIVTNDDIFSFSENGLI